MIFTHSGNAGDIIYSIPTIQKLAGEEEKYIYVKAVNYEDGYLNQCEFCRAFIELQGIEVIPFIPQDGDWSYYKWPGLKFDYDLDIARRQPRRGTIYMIKRYYDQFGITDDPYKSWLRIDDLNKRKENFGLFHVTPRWNAYFCDWNKVYRMAKERHDKLYFIGFKSDHQEFQQRYNILIDHIETIDLLDMARLVRDSNAVYMNQCPTTALAQGLGKTYYLWLSSDGRTFMKKNCRMGTDNENILNENIFINT